MSGKRRVVGFDRKLELSWLDATAAQVANGATVDELHAYLWKMLDGSVSAGSSGFNSDRGKTITVLKRIWCLVPDELGSFRNRALAVLNEVKPEERVAVHWPLCIVAYPFFADVADAVGRLLSLQGTLQTSDVRRRAAEIWGDRVITRNGSQRILRCFVNWGLLGDGERRGSYVRVKQTTILSQGAVEILLEALLRSQDGRAVELGKLERFPALFPFDLPTLLPALRSSPRFQVERQGVDVELVRLSGAGLVT